MKDIIRIDDLTYRANNKIILNKINLIIEKNTWVSIVGPNGAGKTTLIKILSGILPYEGCINIGSLILDKRNKKEIIQNIGVVLDFSENVLIGETVIDELTFSLENLNYPKDEIEKIILDLSSTFKIKKLLNKNIQEITNSEKEIISIVSALTTNPQVLLLDNVFHELSPNQKKELIAHLKEYKKEHKLTILMTTSNLEDTLLTDRIIILNNSIIKEGSTISILKQEKLLRENNLKQPFIIELSQKLMIYNLIDHIYLDERKLVNDLWK